MIPTSPFSSVVSDRVKFWLFTIVFIPSITCSIFTLYHFLFDRHLRQTLNNHVIILVLLIGLIYQLTIYPWMMFYFFVNSQWNRSVTFCFIWTFIDWVLYILQTMLFAWITIERHILIFHDRYLLIQKNRIYFHYLPIVILVCYCLLFYTIVDFFPSCQNTFNNSYMRCIYFCINDNYKFYLWETIVHQIVPGGIIILCSISLFVRVIWKKSRVNQRRIQWKKYRKMTIQVLSISLIYIIFYFPYAFLNVMHLFGFMYHSNRLLTDGLDFLSYFMLLFLPFVCTLTLPKLNKKLEVNFYLRQLRHDF